MSNAQPFTIDPADPEALRARLAEVEREVVERRGELARVQQELSHWEALYRHLNVLANPPSRRRPAGGETLRERILRVVEESDRPVGLDDVAEYLPGVRRRTVSWNLSDLGRKGKIQRVGKRYARLDSEPRTPPLNGAESSSGA